MFSENTSPTKPKKIRARIHRMLRTCHDCGAKPGQPHLDGCDVEHCSVCGWQRLQCNCRGHDPLFARWTGIFPGAAEASLLGLDLNTFAKVGLGQVFFVKPKKSPHR